MGVKVCDAIMGSGKTEAVIRYINEHPEKKFLYLTPYLDEAKRIRHGCPDAHFIEPSDKLPQYELSKSVHTLALIRENRNICSTHQAMNYYTADTARELNERGYMVIVDEAVNIMQKAEDIKPGDVALAEQGGYIQRVSDIEYRRTDKPYDACKYSRMFHIMESRSLCKFKDEWGRVSPYYWVLPPTMFREVSEIIVLTYLFHGSEFESFFKMNNIQYSYIGIRRTSAGGYALSDRLEYIPEYTKRLRDMIHVEDGGKINDVGENHYALSLTWYKSKGADNPEMKRLKKNIRNFFRDRHGDQPASKRMCGTYARGCWSKIKGDGYGKSDVTFCERSTNQYADRTVLAYPVNVFPNGTIASFYQSKGVPFDRDLYALSIMVQWIWRSAIRNGEEIYIYVPSKRMRTLLLNWIEETSKGGNASE